MRAGARTLRPRLRIGGEPEEDEKVGKVFREVLVIDDVDGDRESDGTGGEGGGSGSHADMVAETIGEARDFR